MAVSKPSKSYARNFSYNAAGAVTGMQLGNMLWESTQFNSRLQSTQIALGTGQSGTAASNMLKLVYGYGTTANNGNVLSQTIKVENVGAAPGFEAVQTYIYDEVNRLKSVAEVSTPNGGTASQSWKQTYLYDRFGNRTFDAANTTTFPTNFIAAVHNPTISTANNQFTSGQGYLYDAAGNVTQDAEGRKFVYDGENKQTTFGVGGSTTNGGKYSYDGDGHRVRKEVAGEVTIFVYNAAGQMVAEYATNPPSSPQISYLTSDGLGTPRISTDISGTALTRHDYLPFGEEINPAMNRSAVLGYKSDGIDQRFTGKERDRESGLDFFGARFYASYQGRFLSPDKPFVDQDSMFPQSWNIYVYTRNSPLKYVDDTGLKIEYASPELQKISEALEDKSASYKAAMDGFRGDNAPNLTVTYGDAGRDANGRDLADGVTNTTIKPDDYTIDGTDENNPVRRELPGKLISATVIIDQRLKKDENRTEVLEHEMGHADDARQNSQTYLKNSQANDANKGATPHDQRPNEKVANAFQKRVAAEVKATERTRHEEEKQRRQEEKNRQKRAN